MVVSKLFLGKHYLLACLCLLTFGSLTAQSSTYKAILTGRAVTTPVLSPGTGEIDLEVTDNQLIITGTFDKLSSAVEEEGINIRFGLTGQNGSIVFGLIPTLNDDERSGSFDAALNTFSINPGSLSQLDQRSLYITIETTQHPEGEIRGQITPDALTTFSSNLYGSNQVPSILSQGKGSITLELVSSSEIIVSGSFSDLTGAVDTTIQGGAALYIGQPGRNGDFVLVLRPTLSADGRSGTFSAANNTFNISTQQLIELGERRMYFNIHTSSFSGGELRGQLVPTEASALFRAGLSGVQAVPNNLTDAEGMVLAEVYSDTLIIVSGSFQGTNDILVNNVQSRPGIYAGFAGENGVVQFPLNLLTTTDTSATIPATNNVFLLSNAQTAQLMARALHISIPTLADETGELRGQLVPEGEIFLNGLFSGVLQIPTVNTFGSGNLIAELKDSTLQLSGSFTNLDGNPMDTAYLRLGYVGQTGERQFPIVLNNANPSVSYINSVSNTFTLSPTEINTLLNRQYYINLPTTTHPSGELRAQLLPEAQNYFVATLSSTSQSNLIETMGLGQILLEKRGDQYTASGSFQNLSSNYRQDSMSSAAIRLGLAGLDGPQVLPVIPTLDTLNLTLGQFEPAANQFFFDLDMQNNLAARSYYANIPSMNHPSGELRGQLLPIGTAYFTSTLSGFNQVLPNRGNGSGALKADLIGNQLTLTGSVQNIGIEEVQAGLFVGGAGKLGMINFSPAVEEHNDSTYTFRANNVFDLNEAQLAALKQEQFYLSISTDDLPDESVRGQLLKEPNFAPVGTVAFELPLDGDVISSEGDPTSPAIAKWIEPEDENDLYYIFESSEFIDFRIIDDTELLVDVDSVLNFNLGALDTFLLNKGLEVGDTIQRYYRFRASDGSLNTIGRGNFATVIRGNQERMIGADLELSITAPNEEPYSIFSEIPYTITLVNKGPQAARDIFVSAPFPDGMVFTSAETNAGMYNIFFRWWQIPDLAVGDTATLDLTLFTLIENEPITNFVEVIGAAPFDPDSRPDNGEAPIPQEDDEAAFTLRTEEIVMGGDTADLQLTMEVLEDEFVVFNNSTFILRLENLGPDSVANVNVSALIPEGMVFTNASATHGQYRVVTQDWVIPFLENGEVAELELTLFSLIEGRPLTLFSQVIASDQFDPDSEPSNDLDNVPDEDDEAAVTILPERGIQGGDTSDLELTLEIDRMEYEVFSNYTYTFTLTNRGPEAASNIFVGAELPDSLALTSRAASLGEWNLFFQYWFVPFVDVGETQTLKLELFTLSRETPIDYFVQIIEVDQVDPDSEPNNNQSGMPTEDDEALITLIPSAANFNPPAQATNRVEAQLHPVPATDWLQLQLTAETAQEATLSIVNERGLVVGQKRVSLFEGNNQFQLELSALPAGSYFIVLSEGTADQRWQFVKVE